MKRLPALLLLGFLAACGQGGEGDRKAASAGSGAAPPPAEVDVITVAVGSATITQDLPGRLLAYRTAQVRARVEGVIEQRLFAEGSDIKAGTPLFRIDARSYQAQVAAFELDFWGRVASLETAARANFFASEFAQRAFRLSLIAEVANAYYSFAELAARLTLAEATTRRALAATAAGLFKALGGI